MIKVYQTIECKNNVITTIMFKGVKVKVEFKGGNVMKGIHARLYTNDPFVQKALDESDQKGRLYRFIQELTEGGEQRPGADAPGVVARAGADAPGVVARAGADAAGVVAAGRAQGAGEPMPGFPSPAAIEGENDGVGAGEQRMEFDNLAEAITYIATTWGEQVENENQARKYIEEKTGVKPVIHKG